MPERADLGSAPAEESLENVLSQMIGGYRISPLIYARADAGAFAARGTSIGVISRRRDDA